MTNAFEARLAGGHPNSLGDTVAVVGEVLENPPLMAVLFACYGSADPVVRLRVSNAMKRIAEADKAILVPYLDRLLGEVAQIDQASAQWTLARLFGLLANEMTSSQRALATQIMQNNLANHQDWIVLNTTMDTLAQWAKQGSTLAQWLAPHLARLCQDPRKSVARRAEKLLARHQAGPGKP